MQPVREVYSLLMPVQGGRIIVPRAAVAEVTGYTRPKDRPENAPDFVLGFIDWQGQKIPLVSYEAARGQGVPELGRRTRIAVVFGIAGRLDPDVFAIVTQGYPYLVRVNENVLQREEMESEDALVLARVRMANEKPLIPDFDRLEVLIAEGLGITAGGEDAAAEPESLDELDALGNEEDFDAGLIVEDDSETDSGESAADPAADVDLGDVTSFGVETGYSIELENLPGAVADEETGEDGAAVDVGEVTAFGTETNYSVEMDELSEALQAGDDTTKDDEDGYAIDLSGLEADVEGTDDESAETPAPEDDAFDFSDLTLDDDEKRD